MWDMPTNAAITAAFDAFEDRVRDNPLAIPHAAAYLGMSPSDAYFFFSKTGSMWHKDAIYGAARRRLHSFCLSVLEDLLQYYREVGSYTLQSSK